MTTRGNVYAARTIDPQALNRHADRRDDADWIAARAAAADAKLLPYWRAKQPFRPNGDAVAFNGATLRAVFDDDRPKAFLGVDADGAWFGVDLSDLDDPGAALDAPPDMMWDDLRLRGAALPWRDAARLAHLRALMEWRRRWRFCPICGSLLAPDPAGSALRCTNAACGATHFPRIDPAAIMLPVVPDPGGDPLKDRCLLSRAPRFPPGMHSTLAGFVEPGESLEDTVVRETFEESGLRVLSARYLHSQPWPFPQSLMVGFIAIVEDGPLTLDATEIAEAHWLTRADVRANVDRPDFSLPRADSIARRIIDEWAADDRRRG